MKTFLKFLLAATLTCQGCYSSVTEPSVPKCTDASNAATKQTDAIVQDASDKPKAKPKVVPRKVLIIGDSEACVIKYVAKDVAKEYAASTGNPLDEVNVVCKGATTVQYWGPRGYAERALKAYPKSDTLLVFLGTNHYPFKKAPDTSKLLGLVKKNSLNCVWVGNVAVRGKKWPINKLMREAVTPTCSYYDAEEAPIKLWDGYHPDIKNAKKWLSDVWKTIPLRYEESNDRKE